MVVCLAVLDQPVQGVPRLSPNASWDRLQPPSALTRRMDGWIYNLLKTIKLLNLKKKRSKDFQGLTQHQGEAATNTYYITFS